MARRAARGRALLALGLLAAAAQLQAAAALYHTSNELLHWFSHCSAKRPDAMRFEEIKDQHTGTFLPVATITAGANDAARKKPVVMFVFGEHARELITGEVGVWLARLLVDPHSSAWGWPELPAALERAGVGPDGRSSGSNGTSASATAKAKGATDWVATARGWVAQLLSRLEVVVVPIESLTSRRLVESGQLCVRKTASNVDLNRNYPFGWRQAPNSDEQYGGNKPFSEPQSRLMKRLFDSADGRLLGYVNVHSGEWALYTPWDSKPAYGPGLPADLPDLVAKVGRLCNCQAGPAGAVSGYLAYGTSMDYLYVHKRVPYPLTVEVYGGGNEGVLRNGAFNKGLTDWPVVTKADAPTRADAAFQRRLLLAQQQPGHARRLAQQQSGDAAPATQAGAPRALQQQQQQQPAAAPAASEAEAWQQPLWQAQRPRRRHWQRRRRNRLHQALGADAELSGGAKVALLPGSAAHARLLPEAAVGDAAAAADASAGLQPGPVSPEAFSAGSDLAALRQQAQAQLARASAPGGGAAAGGRASDAILQLVDGAPPHERGCFMAFNPATEAQYRRVVSDWLAASLVMLRHMADSPDGRRMAAALGGGGGGATADEAAPAAAGGARGLLGGHC